MSWWSKGFDSDLNHANYVANIYIFLKHKLIHEINLCEAKKSSRKTVFKKSSLVPAIHENNIYQPVLKKISMQSTCIYTVYKLFRSHVCLIVLFYWFELILLY